MNKLNLFNFVFFQSAWFLLVYRADTVAALILIPFIIIHLIIGKQWKRDTRTGFCFALIGAVAESFVLGSESVSISGAYQDFPPVWLLTLWFCFGLSTHYSFSWLRLLSGLLRIWQFIAGALLAPFAYYGADVLGAIDIHNTGLVFIGLAWSISLPLCLIITDTISTRHDNATA